MVDNPLNILFATTEATPYIKTGGLADVSGSLPPVMRTLGNDVRLILPAYPETVDKLGDVTEAAVLRAP